MNDGFTDGEPVEREIQRWQKLEESRRRRQKVVTSFKVRPRQLWDLPSVARSTCAANWLFGRFQRDKAVPRWLLGSYRYGMADGHMRELYAKPWWTGADVAKVVALLEHFTKHLRVQRERVRVKDQDQR